MKYLIVDTCMRAGAAESGSASGGAAYAPSWDPDRIRALLSENGLSPQNGETVFFCEHAEPSYVDAMASAAPTEQITFIELPYFRAEAVCDILSELSAEADLMLFSAGAEGDELACRLSMRSGGSAFASACSFSFSEEGMLVSRKTYAGHVMGSWLLTDRPWFVSLNRMLQTGTGDADTGVDVSTGSDTCTGDSAGPESEAVYGGDPNTAAGRDAAGRNAGRKQIRFFTIDLQDPLHPADRVCEKQEHTDALPDSDFILAGGRGLGSVRGAEQLRAYAQRLGAAAGASRPVVMSAWMPMEDLLGVSGSIAAPKLALVCGASGAPAFFTGIEQAKTIISVNSDPKAPIADKSDLAVTGSWQEVLSELDRLL